MRLQHDVLVFVWQELFNMRTANNNLDIPTSSDFLCERNHLNIEKMKSEVFASGQMAAACLYCSSLSLEPLIKHLQCDADETEEVHTEGGLRRR